MTETRDQAGGTPAPAPPFDSVERESPATEAAIAEGQRLRGDRLAELLDSGQAPAAAAWDCAAYGPEGRTVGALCFASPELGERECRTEGECAALLAGERHRVFDAIGGMAAVGDPTGKYLAARITSPGQLLGGGEPTDHEFVPGDADSTFGEAGTWCAVWLDGGGESDQCGMPRDAHWAAGEGRADG